MGRGQLKTRLTKPKAPAFFYTADATLPDLIAGETGRTDAAVLVVNASGGLREDLVIVARVGSGPEKRTSVPSLVPLSVQRLHSSSTDWRRRPPKLRSLNFGLSVK